MVQLKRPLTLLLEEFISEHAPMSTGVLIIRVNFLAIEIAVFFRVSVNDHPCSLAVVTCRSPMCSIFYVHDCK